ncbi:hypothetical protein BaRGS_00017926 [Batillaria attramentaria]|uniref:Polyketide synthase n=1 Tax=Batillaria attramentaria TaxID=370345 RepID=A0ABD0KVR0_9CAEN
MTLQTHASDPNSIAIVGVGCRTPGADNTREFWNLLVNVECHVTEVPESRWNLNAYLDSNPMATGKAYVQRGGFIKDPEGFDNGLYSINDFEASQMDPQQRFLLDCTIMALEDAGITRAQISGTNTAVFIGCMNSDYGSAYIGATSKVGSYTATGVGTSVQAGRLSYVFNLLGPSMVLDTACSSSLIAIHQGCQAITAGECDMAICGGVNSMTLPDMYIQLCKAGMLSPTGLSQAFSDKADGYTRGEGCGIIILKRLGDALHDGDKIWATVCTGTNQDGHTVSPMTAPSGEQQKKLLHSVYGKFGVDVANLDYIEAHGTGTPAGDPVEVNALGEFFKQAGQPRDRYIGSLKTNIGHTESAAGVLGVIKVVLMMKNDMIVPSLHCDSVNPKINLEDLRFVIPKEVVPWFNPYKLAGCNSFGFGGSNCHAILRSHRETTKQQESRQTHCIVCFSANSKESLVGSLKTLQQDDQFLQLDVHDVSYTSTVRRDHYSHRAAFVTDSTHDLLASVGNRLERGKFSMALPKPLNVIFVFCGMGTAWQGMCTEFLTENSVFRNTMMEVDKELSAHVKWSLAQRLQQREDPTQDPVFGPLAIFACQVALASVWQSLGIQPASIVGQSIGEVAAAYTAGCLTLADAVKIVYHRSKLLANVTGGSMIVVQHTNVNRVKEVLSELDAKASIALEYSPVACAVSADAKSMSSVKGQLLSKLTSDHRLMQITDLPVSVAYHSQHVEPCVKNLGRALKGVDAASPRVEYVSAVTGEPLEDAPRAQYWMDHLRQPVLFSKAVSRAVSEKKPANTVLLEIGPKPVLPAHLNDMFPGQNFTSLPSMSRQAELKTFLQAVANLYELGANVRWEELPSQGTQITDIPRYVFNKRYNKEQTEMELILNSGCNFYRASHLYTWPIRDDVTSFKLVITPLTVPSVYDHVLSRTIVIPGALYAEAGLAVARYSNIQSPVAVSVNFERAMSLKKGEVLGLDLRFESSQNTEFWRAPLVVHKDRRRLATIRILETQQGTQQVASLDLVRSRCKEKVTRKNVYSSLRRSGFEYGEAFALLGDADRNATECLVQLEVNDKVRAEMAATRIHPCILDCMLQATLLLVPDDRGTMKDMLPKSMGKLSVYRNMESTMLIHARRKQTAPDMIVYDQRLLSLDGHVIAELDDFVVQSLTPQTDSTSSAMLKSEWHKALETPRVSSHDELQQSKRNRMIYVTNANLTQETSGVKESSKVVQYDSSSMDQNGLDAIRAALGDCSDVEAVVLIYSGDIDEAADGESVQSKLVNMCCVIQTILNTLNDHACTLPFVLCTSNAWPLIVDATPRRPVSPISTALWGLLRTVLDENVYPNVVAVDLHLSNLTWTSTESSLRLIMSKPELIGYPEVVVTQEAAYVNQVLKATQNMAVPPKRLCGPVTLNNAQGTNAVLSEDPSTISNPTAIIHEGSRDSDTSRLCTLRLESFAQAPDKLLNTKVSCESLFPDRETHSKTYVVMGLEVVGVKQDGSKCKVAGCHPKPIGAEVTVSDDVTLPVADIPSYETGDLSKLVLLWGLKKLASTTKISILASVNTKHLADLLVLMLKSSQNTPLTVSIVLLEDVDHAGEFHETLISLVALDIDLITSATRKWKNAKQMVTCSTLVATEVTSFFVCQKPNAEVCLLDMHLLYQPQQLKQVVPSVKSWLTTNKKDAPEISRLLHVRLPQQPGANDLGQLLRFEVHKLSELSVLTEEDELFKKDCAYVVVGGLTGLGWLCVEFLARSNAGYIAIMNRRVPSEEQATNMKNLSSKTHCQIQAFQADVSSKQSIASALQKMEKQWPGKTLKGVFTGAAVLQDGLFSSMERSSFEWVLTPKVKGTWNLHQLTKNIPLDYFVMHSSVASVLGNLGQANYTAGNAFLDGLAYYRRHQGLAAQTINWGPLDTGLLDNQDALKRRLDSMGFHLASQQEITETLRNLLLLNLTQAVPVKIDTELYAKKIHGTGLRPLILRYQHFVPLTTAQTTGIYNFGDLDKVKFLESAERLQAYEAYVTELTCRMLSLDVSYVTGDVSLLDLGLDSVTGNMMINQIHRDTTFKVEAVHIFAGETSVTTLAKTLDEYAQNELAKDQDQEKL